MAESTSHWRRTRAEHEQHLAERALAHPAVREALAAAEARVATLEEALHQIAYVVRTDIEDYEERTLVIIDATLCAPRKGAVPAEPVKCVGCGRPYKLQVWRHGGWDPVCALDCGAPDAEEVRP